MQSSANAEAANSSIALMIVDVSILKTGYRFAVEPLVNYGSQATPLLTKVEILDQKSRCKLGGLKLGS